MSAASRAAVYLAICCRMASPAALASSALLRDDPGNEKARARSQINHVLRVERNISFQPPDCPYCAPFFSVRATETHAFNMIGEIRP